MSRKLGPYQFKKFSLTKNLMQSPRIYLILLLPAFLWWFALTPFALLMMDWFTPIWIGGALGIVGLCLSSSKNCCRSLLRFFLTLILLVLGIISLISCVVYAIPGNTELANPQTPKLFFMVLLGFRVSAVLGVFGGLIHVWYFSRLGIAKLMTSNS